MSRSTRKWRETVGWVSPGSVATRSPAVHSPPASASSKTRLLGSAMASKASIHRVLHAIYIDDCKYKPATLRVSGRSGLGTPGEFFLITAHALTEFACVLVAALTLGEVGAY